MMQIPLQNTGSLPDLTNVDFASPIHVPLDQDHNSSYNSVSILTILSMFISTKEMKLIAC